MFLLCRRCGYAFTCNACSVSMTYHKSINRLLCHYCGLTRKPATTCPECSSEYIHYVGEGTEQVEMRLRELLGGARIGRIDRDTIRHIRDYERLLGQFRARELDILIGTQMIAKGHDFPPRDAGGRACGRRGAIAAGFPHRRTNVSTADSGRGAVRARRRSWRSGDPELLSGSLQFTARGQASIRRVLRSRGCISGRRCSTPRSHPWPG